MIVPLAMVATLSTCAPSVGRVTMSSLVQYESGWRPWALYDNTARRQYLPSTKGEAVAIASTLIARGHLVDIGYAQIDSGNLPGYGLSVDQVLNPCTNLATGADILNNAYFGRLRPYDRREPPSTACKMTLETIRGSLWCRAGGAVDRYGPGTTALFHALEAYNTNRFDGNPAYARGVFREAFSGVDLQVPATTIRPVTQNWAASSTYQPSTGSSITVRPPAQSVLIWQTPAPPKPRKLTGVDVFEHTDGPSKPPGAFPPVKSRNSP
jgi:type IV secretion system protein VirB1